MEGRDINIMHQVVLKAAVDMERGDVDLATPEGQHRFVQVYSFLEELLSNAIAAAQPDEQKVAQIIQGQFPGTVVDNGAQPYGQPNIQAQPHFQLSVKGNQFGPLPEWLYEQAASKGVTEVYDNRDRAQGTKRPHFRATTGGDNAPAFWPPR